MVSTHYIEELDADIEIEWERGDNIDTHQHEIHYQADGEDDRGRKYEATWIQVGGDNGETEIDDIELTEYPEIPF